MAFYRRFFGVDFTDESFYITIAQWFAVGGQPFVDEIHPAQSFAIVLSPFVKLYTRLNNGLDGIVLFARFLHLAFVMVIGYLVARVLSANFDKTAAVLAGLLVAVFVPFDIPAPSYNTLGLGFMCLGAFSGFAVLDGMKHQRWWAILAGFSFSMAAFCYPPLVLVAVLGLAPIPIVKPDNRWQVTINLLIGAAVPGLIMLVFLVSAGQDGLSSVAAYADAIRVSDGITAKFISSVQGLATNYPFRGLALFSAAVLLLRKRFPLVAGISFCFALLLPFGETLYVSAGRSMGYTWVLGTVTPLFFFLAPRSKSARLLFFYVWGLSAAAGMVTMLSSVNGEFNFGLGFFPAAIVSMALFVPALNALLPIEMPILSRGAPAVLAVAILAVSGLQFTYVYRDDPIPQLTATVTSGPYEGLKTGVERADFIDRLTQDLTSTGGDSIAFFDAFPAGYLMATQAPKADTSWVVAWERLPGHANRDMHAEYWRRFGLPDRIVQMHFYFLETGYKHKLKYKPHDPLMRILRTDYEPSLRRRAYTIWSRKERS